MAFRVRAALRELVEACIGRLAQCICAAYPYALANDRREAIRISVLIVSVKVILF